MAVFVVVTDADNRIVAIKERNADGVLEEGAEVGELRTLFNNLRRSNPLGILLSEFDKNTVLVLLEGEPDLTREQKDRYAAIINRVEPGDVIKVEVRSILEDIPLVLRWGGSDGGKPRYKVVNYFIDP